VKEIRFDSAFLREDQLEELLAWVRSIGVEPNNVCGQGIITMGESSYQLHLSKFIRDEYGKLRLNRALDEVVSEPLVIDLGTDRTWPAWLNSQPDPDLLRRLDRAVHRIANAIP
jgi:hypothetical protein